VLAHGGWFILNIKNHYRRHTFQDVAKWYVETLEDLGFVVVEVRKVAMNGDQNTAAMRKHGQKTVDHELVVLLRKPFLGPNQPAAGV
jgi:hypothetical protein